MLRKRISTSVLPFALKLQHRHDRESPYGSGIGLSIPLEHRLPNHPLTTDATSCIPLSHKIHLPLAASVRVFLGDKDYGGVIPIQCLTTPSLLPHTNHTILVGVEYKYDLVGSKVEVPTWSGPHIRDNLMALFHGVRRGGCDNA